MFWALRETCSQCGVCRFLGVPERDSLTSKLPVLFWRTPMTSRVPSLVHSLVCLVPGTWIPHPRTCSEASFLQGFSTNFHPLPFYDFFSLFSFPTVIFTPSVKQYCISCLPAASGLVTVFPMNRVTVKVRLAICFLMWHGYCTWLEVPHVTLPLIISHVIKQVTLSLEHRLTYRVYRGRTFIVKFIANAEK